MLIATLSLLIIPLATARQAKADLNTTGRCSSVQLVGHRGTNQGNVRGNTLPALKKAVADGADALEIDIHRTKPTKNPKTKKKSGVWVLNHDATVVRTVNGKNVSKTIAKTTYNDLKKFAPDIMTFAQAVAYAKASGKYLYVEIKPDSVAKGSMQYFSDTIKKYGMQKSTTFISFNTPVLKKYKSLKGHAGRIAQVTNKKLPTSAAGLASYAKNIRKYADAVIIRYTLSTPASVAGLKGAGLSVLVYTTNAATPEVDNSDTWNTHISNGADGIITDNAAGFTAWCSASSQPQPAPADIPDLPGLEDPEEP